MMLAIDVGNTNIVFGVHDGETWVSHWRIATVHSKMPDEYGVLFRDMLRDGGIDREDLHKAVISSVVPVLTGKIKEMVASIIGKPPLIVGPGIRTGLKIRIGNPSELGTDIVCNCVAAYEKVQDSCLVVDFGTALTFSAVAAGGEIRGVAIAPGLQSAAGGPLLEYSPAAPGLAGSSREGDRHQYHRQYPVRGDLRLYGAGGIAHRPYEQRTGRCEGGGRHGGDSPG